MRPSQIMLRCAASYPTTPSLRSRKRPMSETSDRFPRSPDLPTQSPFFWVGQKDRYLRQLLIRDIEAITGRRLLVYFSNRFKGAQINQRDCDYFVELFGDLKGRPCDLLIETGGGETPATEALASYVRQVSPDFRAIVPSSAKSNGTLLCLAANEIVMSSSSQLGPIEPAVQGIPCSILRSPEIANAQFCTAQTRRARTPA